MTPLRRVDGLDVINIAAGAAPNNQHGDAVGDSAASAKRARCLQEEEASKRIKWSEAVLSRRPSPVHDTCPPPAVEPPLSVHGESRGYFVREGGVATEEVTPPPAKSQSSVEGPLAATLTADEPSAVPSPPFLGRSASIVNAAAALLGASREGCALGAASKDAARRRLTMHGGKAPREVKRKRARSRAVREQRDGFAPQACIDVGGVRVALLSGAPRTTLEVLSMAFQYRPSPSHDDLLVISRHVGVPAEQLAVWFESRRTLAQWVGGQPHLTPIELAQLFYPEAAEVAAQRETGMAA